MASPPLPSVRVVEAVARKKGVSPTELSPPLMTVIDPDALDALVRLDEELPSDSIAIEFEYQGYAVRVRNRPTVHVTVRDTDPSTPATDSTPGQRAETKE